MKSSMEYGQGKVGPREGSPDPRLNPEGRQGLQVPNTLTPGFTPGEVYAAPTNSPTAWWSFGRHGALMHGEHGGGVLACNLDQPL